MPKERTSRSNASKVAQMTGYAPEAVEAMSEDEAKSRKKHVRIYNTDAQKKMCDKLLTHMEDRFTSSHDSQSIQQLANSITQVTRLRHDIENRSSEAGYDNSASSVDAESEKARFKMLNFGS